MTASFFWGLLAASSLIAGALLTFWIRIGSRPLGLIMAFGSGVLISAVAFEITPEAIKLAAGTPMAAIGLFAGAITFFAGNSLVDRMGGSKRKSIKASHGSELGLPILLGIVLDGIPESIVIGLSLLEGSEIGLSMLLAVFLSNVPETIAATTGLLEGGWSRMKIIGLWTFVVLLSALASLAGYLLFEGTSPSNIAFIQAFACGAILVMLSDTMMPEAFEHGGKLAGIITVIGFGLAVYISVMH
jgi:zinc transporter, ZIP family